MLERCGEEGVGDHDGKQPDRATHALGHAGAPPPTGCFRLQGKQTRGRSAACRGGSESGPGPCQPNLHDGEVTVHADAGEEQDAAVHVDKVAEGVQVGAGETRPAAVVEQDASGQRQVDQQVRHRQVDGVDDGGGLRLGAEAKHVKGHRVQDGARLWMEGIQVVPSGTAQLTAFKPDMREFPPGI